MRARLYIYCSPRNVSSGGSTKEREWISGEKDFEFGWRYVNRCSAKNGPAGPGLAFSIRSINQPVPIRLEHFYKDNCMFQPSTPELALNPVAFSNERMQIS
jgi:hypothetical protein